MSFTIFDKHASQTYVKCPKCKNTYLKPENKTPYCYFCGIFFNEKDLQLEFKFPL